MAEFAALRPKICSYLIDDNGENKKGEVTKWKLKFEYYKHCSNQLENEIIQLEKNKLDDASVRIKS